MKEARHAKALIAKGRKQLEDEAAEMLRDDQHLTGAARCNQFVVQCPAIAQAGAVPALSSKRLAENLSLFDWCVPCSSEVPRVIGVLDSMPTTPAVEQARNALLQAWNELNSMKMSAGREFPENFDVKAKSYNKKPSCYEAQMCMCGARGDLIWRFKIWLCAQLKATFHSDDEKEMLDDGCVVIRFSCCSDVDAEPELAGVVDSDAFFDAAFLLKSPWRPTFATMGSTGKLPSGNIMLHSCDAYMTCWKCWVTWSIQTTCRHGC